MWQLAQNNEAKRCCAEGGRGDFIPNPWVAGGEGSDGGSHATKQEYKKRMNRLKVFFRGGRCLENINLTTELSIGRKMAGWAKQSVTDCSR